jgi:large subunit ribosomal protein L11
MLELKINPSKICPVQITVYKDKSFDFVVKLSNSSPVIGGAAKLKSGR